MTHPRFFGYGSLVNLATHDYPDPRPATLAGWRRVWCHAKDRPVAFLSAEPHHDTDLHGITAQVPYDDWSALDLREYAYLRRDVSDQFGGPTAVYEANPAHTAPASSGHPILLSYLDVVVAGFEALIRGGADHFFATTARWGRVLDDRNAPLYPRAQPLSAATRATVDAHLTQLAMPVQPAENAGLLVDAIQRAHIVAPAAAHDAQSDPDRHSGE